MYFNTTFIKSLTIHSAFLLVCFCAANLYDYFAANYIAYGHLAKFLR